MEHAKKGDGTTRKCAERHGNTSTARRWASRARTGGDGVAVQRPGHPAFLLLLRHHRQGHQPWADRQQRREGKAVPLGANLSGLQLEGSERQWNTQGKAVKGSGTHKERRWQAVEHTRKGAGRQWNQKERRWANLPGLQLHVDQQVLVLLWRHRRQPCVVQNRKHGTPTSAGSNGSR